MPGPSIDEVNYTLPTSKKRRIAHAQPPSTQQPSTQQPLQQSQQQPAPQPPPRPLQQQPKDPPKKKVRTKSAPNKNSSVSVQPKVPDVIKSKNKQDNRGNCSLLCFRFFSQCLFCFCVHIVLVHSLVISKWMNDLTSNEHNWKIIWQKTKERQIKFMVCARTVW